MQRIRPQLTHAKNKATKYTLRGVRQFNILSHGDQTKKETPRNYHDCQLNCEQQEIMKIFESFLLTILSWGLMTRSISNCCYSFRSME